MYFKLKDSEIKSWWIANMNSKMEFYDVKKGIPRKRLVIVGVEKSQGVWLEPVTVSTGFVSRITHLGVVTNNGVFYPFDEAHPLYLRFLLEAKGHIVATNWEMRKNKVLADIEYGQEKRKDVTFDFVSDDKSDVVFKGYSPELDSVVVFNTFARRDVYNKFGLPKRVEADIYISSFVDDVEKTKLLKLIKRKVV